MQNLMTVEQIDAQIALLQEKLKNVKGRKTEVYTRIVGYHRAVDNWNHGKREEYKRRQTFNINLHKFNELNSLSGCNKKKSDADISLSQENNTFNAIDTNANCSSIAFYKIFTSQLCRNCTPVKNYIGRLPVSGEEIDVTTDLGINASRKYDVLSTPTVILFDSNKNVIKKAHTVEELKTVFEKQQEEILAGS